MFEDNKAPNLSSARKDVKAPKEEAVLYAKMSVQELLRHYEELRKHLPPTALTDMDFEAALLLQLHALQELQSTELDNEELPLNQRVSLASSVSNLLGDLTKRQKEIYSSERFKRIESILIRALSKLPEETAKTFLEEYERMLESISS